VKREEVREKTERNENDKGVYCRIIEELKLRK
jgi:hypothetical protein